MSGITISDAPSAVAAAKCWCHRFAPMRLRERNFEHDGRPTRVSHPGECGWCDYPSSVLISAITEFMGTHHELVEAFERQPATTQRSQVVKAQGLRDEPARPTRTSRTREEAIPF